MSRRSVSACSCWLLLAASLAMGTAAWADGVVSVEEMVHPADSTLPDSKDTAYTLDSHACRVQFQTSQLGKSKLLEKSEEQCPEALDYPVRVGLYEEIIAKIFDSKFFQGERKIKFVWGPLYKTPPLVCRLIRYASTSVEWRMLNARLGNKPVLFDEHSPMPLELGEFMRKAGLAKEMELAFRARGYRLKLVQVGGFASEYIKRLDGGERKCVSDAPIVRIVPNSAELYLLFETMEPPRVDG